MDNNYYIQVVPCPTCGRCPTCGSYKPYVEPQITWTSNTTTVTPEQVQQWIRDMWKDADGK